MPSPEGKGAGGCSLTDTQLKELPDLCFVVQRNGVQGHLKSFKTLQILYIYINIYTHTHTPVNIYLLTETA